MTKFNREVLEALPPLVKGNHKDTDKAVCAMEALARACGLGTTDHPECASPVIGAFCRTLNDKLPTDELRDQLIRPLLPLMVDTANDGHDEERMWLCADAAVRLFAADALDHAGLGNEAKTLRALAPVRDAETARSAESAVWWTARKAKAKARMGLAAEAARAAALGTRLAAESAVRLAEAAEAGAKAAESVWSEAAAWSARSAWLEEWAERDDQYQKAADTLRAICEVGRQHD